MKESNKRLLIRLFDCVVFSWSRIGFAVSKRVGYEFELQKHGVGAMSRRVSGVGVEIRGDGVDFVGRIWRGRDSAGGEVAAVAAAGRRCLYGGEGVRGGGDSSHGVCAHAEGFVGGAWRPVSENLLGRVGEVSFHRFFRHGVRALHSPRWLYGDCVLRAEGGAWARGACEGRRVWEWRGGAVGNGNSGG